MKQLNTPILRKILWGLVIIGLVVGSAYFQDFSRVERVSEHRVKIKGELNEKVAVNGFGEFQVKGMQPFSNLEDAHSEGIFVQIEVAQKLTLENTGRASYALQSRQDNVFLSVAHTGNCNPNTRYVVVSCRPIFEIPVDQLEGAELVISLTRWDGKFNFAEPQIRIPLQVDSEKATSLAEEAQGRTIHLPEFDEGVLLD